MLWINDYHLLLLPGLLRKKRPNCCIGFFLHTPFPELPVFSSLRFHKRISQSLAKADIVGVYTDEYKNNIERALSRNLDAQSSRIRSGKYKRNVGIFPVGIDDERIANVLKGERFKSIIQDIRQHIHAQYVILSADRLDYTKGILNKIRAFDVFMERNSGLIGRLQIIIVVAKSRMELQDNITLNDMIKSAVNIVNYKYS
jgi:trehalose 6-phosphate synthase/phosphatase